MRHIVYFLLRLMVMMTIMVVGCIGLVRWEDRVAAPIVAEHWGGNVMVYDGVCFIMGRIVLTDDVDAWCTENGSTSVVLLK